MTPAEESRASLALEKIAAHPAGRPALILAFAFGLWLIAFPSFFAVMAAITVLAYFRSASRYVVAAATVSLWIGSDRLGWGMIQFISLEQGWALAATSFSFRICALTLIVLVCLGAARLAEGIAFVGDHPITSLLVVFFLLIGTANALPPPFSVGVWAAILIFGKFFWFLGYGLHHQKQTGQRLGLIDALSFFPFWSDQNIPIPNGPGVLQANEAKTDAELARVQAKGARLLVWSIVLFAAKSWLEGMIFGRENFVTRLIPVPSLYLPNPLVLGLEAVTQTNISVASRWLIVFAIATSYLLTFAYYYGVIVAIARMSGFDIFRSMYRPFEARSFAEFWRRTMYYYSQLVTTFFLIPALSRLSFVRHRQLRRMLATWIAIFGAAVIYHFTRDVRYFAALSGKGAANAFVSQWAFYFIVGFFASASIWIGKKFDPWGPTFAGEAARALAYLVFAALLWTIIFDFRYNEGSWMEYRDFAFSLFGRTERLP